MILDGRKVKVETLSLTPKALQFDYLVSDNEVSIILSHFRVIFLTYLKKNINHTIQNIRKF
jgi:hypothetical protein